MGHKIKVTAEIKIPGTPNFLRMTDGKLLPLSACTEESLRELGRLWTEELIEKSRKQSHA